MQYTSAPVIVIGLLALLLFSLEAGFRAGRRVSTRAGEAIAPSQLGAVQGAVLGLLGFLLAFSFAGAGSRFLERQDLITTEANAIGTAFLRAGLLDEPHRTELRTLLRDYTAHRVRFTSTARVSIPASVLREFTEYHDRIWRAAHRGVEVKPSATLPVLNPINDVIDLHSVRLAAFRKHLPMPVLALLLACSALAVGVIGYGSGLGGRRGAPFTVPMVILIASAMYITIDLDYPRAGMLTLSDEPLRSLRFEISEP